MNDSDFVYKSQDVNYLGFLEAQLRDMTGVETLAYELIQNADDVLGKNGDPQTTTFSLDVTDDALIVSNDGRFRPIDFQRLQSIAGGGKRTETGVTGAFGLGFLAVYQITDAPEIFSSNRHWIIRPDAPADQRIQERQIETFGTRFRLPWAFDPSSIVRRTLRIEAVRPQQLDDMAKQLGGAIAFAALFLQRLRLLEVKRNGAVLRRIERRHDGERLQLTDENGDTMEWLLLSTDFVAAAELLRQQYPWQIEESRQDTVQLAIPTSGTLHAGRLYAVLPTADTMPLALHLNADFFPSTDRKRVHFDSGYQAVWNQAAVTAAAAILAKNLAMLPDRLPPTDLWHLLQSAAKTARRVQEGDLPDVFAAFWQAIKPLLPQTPVFYTSSGEWLQPAQGRLLYPSSAVSTAEAVTLLQAMEIPVLHPDLAAYASLLQQIGAPSITVGDVADGLRRAGLTQPIPLPEAPPFLRTLDAWRPLWALLDSLLRGLPPSQRETALADLNGSVLALTDRMILRPLAQIYRGQPETQALFPAAAWLHPDLPADTFPGRYMPNFGVRQAVTLLADTPIDLLQEAWRSGRLDPPRLFRWFEAGQIEIFADDPTLCEAIRRLPVCPIDGELRPLADLFLPGGFDDPLQLANLVDLNAIGSRPQFLRDLGVQELDFDSYLHTYLPRVLGQRPDLPSERRHRLLRLLAARLGEFQDDETLQTQLNQLPLVPCLDGSFRPAAEVYASRQVMELLGRGVHIAEPLESPAQQALYDWLGVRATPAADDLVQALLAASQEWGATPLDVLAQTTIINCWQALAELLQAGIIAPDALATLRGRPVIPNGLQVLSSPDEMLLADRPDLMALFAAWELTMLPADIPWVAAAMAAGVRPLSQAVTLAIAVSGEGEENTAVQARIASRRPLLERLLRAETAAGHAVEDSVLQKVQVVTVPQLHVQARLHIGTESVAAAPQAVVAKWIDGVLYLDAGKQPVSWTDVARELAGACAPGRKAGGLALGIKEVLAAENTEAATAILDDLGYR